MLLRATRISGSFQGGACPGHSRTPRACMGGRFFSPSFLFAFRCFRNCKKSTIMALFNDTRFFSEGKGRVSSRIGTGRSSHIALIFFREPARRGFFPAGKVSFCPFWLTIADFAEKVKGDRAGRTVSRPSDSATVSAGIAPDLHQDIAHAARRH